MQAVEQLQEVRRQLEGADKQAKCWERAAESGAAKIAELQDNFAREQRYCTIKQNWKLRFNILLQRYKDLLDTVKLQVSKQASHLHALLQLVEQNPHHCSVHHQRTQDATINTHRMLQPFYSHTAIHPQ